MTENRPPRPLLKRGNPVKLLELPKGYPPNNQYLIIGNTYDFVGWSGPHEIMITTELKKRYASIPISIAEYPQIEC